MTNLQQGIQMDKPVWKPASRNTLSVLLADVLLLLLGLFGVAQCFVTAFSLPADRLILTVSIVLFAGMFIGIFSMKRFILPVLLLLAAVYCGTAYWLRTYFLQGFIITTNRVMSELGSHSRFIFPLYRVDLPRGDYEEACTIFLIFLLFFLSCFLGWAIRRRHSFWLSLAGTAPFLLVPLGFTIMPTWPSVLMLLAFWATLLLSRLSANSSFGRTAAAGKVSLLALPAVILSLLLLNFFIPQEDYVRSPSVESLRTELEAGIYQSPLLNPGSADSQLGRANLSRSGNLQYTGKTVLRVRNPQKTPIYLHAFSSSVYTGTSWEPLPDSAYEELEQTLYFNPQNMAGQFFSLYAQPEERDSLFMEVEIENIGANKKCIFAPYGLATRPEELSGGAFVNDSYIQSSSLFGSRNYSLQAWNVPGYSRSVSLESDAPFTVSEQAYRSFANTHYTQLPQEIKMKLRWLCEQVGIPNAQSATQSEVVNAVVDYVRSSGTYTLSPGTTPAGRDFVDYFLFENHKGYCVHFASSAVAMLRAQGIPARYAEGYAVTAADYGVDGWADIPDRRSHAWAEVYTPGLGWQPVEATPGVHLSAGQMNEPDNTPESTPNSEPESEAESEPESSSELESEAENASALESGPDSSLPDVTEGSTSHLATPVLLPIAIAGGCILLLLLRRAFLLWRRKRGFSVVDVNQRALHLYQYLTQLSDFGEPMDERAEELALKAKFSPHKLSDEEISYLHNVTTTAGRRTYEGLNAVQKLLFKFWKCLI